VTEPLLLTSFLDRAGEFFGDKRIAGYHDGQRVHAYTYRDYRARTEPPLTAPPVRSEDDLAALCDTSGTTGRPKGVGYSHRALYLHTFAACLADGHAISERDTVLHVVPMFHANAWGIPFAALMTGANQVLPGAHPVPVRSGADH
jgi:fatty-acyl-CoA synthase